MMVITRAIIITVLLVMVVLMSQVDTDIIIAKFYVRDESVVACRLMVVVTDKKWRMSKKS